MPVNSYRNKNHAGAEVQAQNDIQKENAPKPGVPEKSEVRSVLSHVTLKDLRKYKPLNLQLDPRTQAGEYATPYPILARYSKILAPTFRGPENIAGNILDRLLESNVSNFVYKIDSMSIPLALNYMYLTTNGISPNNNAFDETIHEALSKTQANSFTQLPWVRATGTTSMKISDSKSVDPRAASLVWYQSFLQNCVLVMKKYEQLMINRQILETMGYNREVSYTNDLLGQLSKKTFKDIVMALSNTVTANYFDFEWFNQTSAFVNVASRKSNSMSSPLVTVRGVYNMPDVKLVYNNGSEDITIIDSSSYTYDLPFDNGTEIKDGKYTWKFTEIIAELIRLFDQYSVLSFCRQQYTAERSAKVNDYVNRAVVILNALKALMSRFSKDASEINTAFMVGQRSGMTRWSKGFVFIPSDIIADEVGFNVVVHSMIRAYFATPNKITWDSTTQTWKFLTLWDSIEGPALYDRVLGGSVLTFSVREVDLNGLDKTDLTAMYPKLFDVVNGEANALCRTGDTLTIKPIKVSAADIKKDNYFSMLYAFADTVQETRIPQAEWSDSVTVTPLMSANTNVLLQEFFNFGQVKIGKSFNKVVKDTTVCMVDGQIEGLASNMTLYIKANAPFRVYTSNIPSNVGVSY